MSTTEPETVTDYNGLWIGIGIGAVFLILFSVLLFFYLRYRKFQRIVKQKKQIERKANSITKKTKFDPEMYQSNNRSDNRLMDEIAKRSDKEKEAFNIFATQNIKNGLDIQIRQEITTRNINRDDIKIEIVSDIKGFTSEDSKDLNIKQVICYSSEKVDEAVHRQRTDLIREGVMAKYREEEPEQEFKKEKSTADDEKLVTEGNNTEVVENEFEDEDVKTVNNFEPKAINKD
jgi:hypothetical protein